MWNIKWDFENENICFQLSQDKIIAFIHVSNWIFLKKGHIDRFLLLLHVHANAIQTWCGLQF